MAQFTVLKQANTVTILGNNVCLNLFKEVIDCWDHEEVNYHLPHLTCKAVFKVLRAWDSIPNTEDCFKTFKPGNDGGYIYLPNIIKYLRYRVSREDFWDYNK